MRSLLIFLNSLRNYRLNKTVRCINSYTFSEEIYIIKLTDLRKCMTTTRVDIATLIIRDRNLRGGRPIIAETGTSVRRIAVLYKQGNSAQEIARLMTENFLMVQAPGFIRGINPKSKIENPQAPAFIRGVNLKSKI